MVSTAFRQHLAVYTHSACDHLQINVLILIYIEPGSASPSGNDHTYLAIGCCAVEKSDDDLCLRITLTRQRK